MPPLRVGWIGLGSIGAPMAQRVQAAGFALTVWARRAEHAQPLVATGAALARDPESLARECDIIATIVGGPDDVHELQRRLLPAARRGTLYIDMTTAAPDNAHSAQQLGAHGGVDTLDAPVTGGVAGAMRGALTSFVGGTPAALERARPLLAAYSARIVHAGPAGAGYRMKLVNQTIVAGTLLGLARGAALARAAGFDPATTKDALAGGSASGYLFDAYLPRMMTASGPVTFTLALLRKDVTLARAEAARARQPLRFFDDALAAIAAACARHGEHAGVQVLANDTPGATGGA